MTPARNVKKWQGSFGSQFIMKKKIIILGAGISGLSTAWKLAKSGAAVEVIEKTARVGGLSASVKKNGYIFDYGIHGLFPSEKGNEEIVKEIRRINGIDWIEVDKKTSLFLFNNYLKYPLGVKDIFLALDPLTSLCAFIDFLKARIKKRLNFRAENDSSFEGWIINRFGKVLFNIYFGPYAYKVWGVLPNNLYSKSLVRRVTTVNVWDIILKALKIDFAKNKHYPQQPSKFYYVSDGTDVLMEKLAREITENNGKIYLESSLKNISLERGKVKSVLIEHNNEQKTLEADYLISTIPLAELVLAISPSLEPKILNFSRSLKNRCLIFLCLMVSKSNVTSHQWIYFSEARFLFNRLNNFTNISKTFSPQNKSSINLEIACFVDDEIFKMTDDKIFETCLNQLKPLNLFRRDDVEDYLLLRVPFAYPVWELDTEDKLKSIYDKLKEIENLYLIGRQGNFIYINMDECVKLGFALSEEILNDQKESGGQ